MNARTKNLSLLQQLGGEYMRTLTIHQKNKGDKKSYFIRPTINGRTMYISFSTEDEARNFLGLLPAATTSTNKKTFIDYFHMNLSKYDNPRTQDAYYRTIRYFDDILKLPLANITKKDLENIYAKSKSGSYKFITTQLNQIARIAGIPEFSQVIFQLDPVRMYKHISKRRRMPNGEEIIQKFNTTTYENPSYEFTRISFLLMCYTGLRVGELCALTEKDIENYEVYVSKTQTIDFDYRKPNAKRKTIVQNNTKGKSDRTVPFGEEILELFLKYFSLKTILANKGRKNFNMGFLNSYVRKIRNDIKIDQPLTCHYGRHIFATLYGSKCENLGEAMALQEMMGHGSFETTRKYVTITKPTAENIMKKLPTLKKVPKKK